MIGKGNFKAEAFHSFSKSEQEKLLRAINSEIGGANYQDRSEEYKKEIKDIKRHAEYHFSGNSTYIVSKKHIDILCEIIEEKKLESDIDAEGKTMPLINKVVGRSDPIGIVMSAPKGGSGKTTLCTSLAYSFALQGLRVGVYDTDHQCNTTAASNERKLFLASPASAFELLLKVLADFPTDKEFFNPPEASQTVK